MVTLEPDGEVNKKNEGLIHRGKRKPKRKRGIRGEQGGRSERRWREKRGSRQRKRHEGKKEREKRKENKKSTLVKLARARKGLREGGKWCSNKKTPQKRTQRCKIVENKIGRQVKKYKEKRKKKGKRKSL